MPNGFFLLDIFVFQPPGNRERYRDLIDAADAIKAMQESSASVDGTFLSIQESCDASALKHKIDLKQQRERDAVTGRLLSSTL